MASPATIERKLRRYKAKIAKQLRTQAKVYRSRINPPKLYISGKGSFRKPTWMLWVLAWFHRESALLYKMEGRDLLQEEDEARAASCWREIHERYGAGL